MNSITKKSGRSIVSNCSVLLSKTRGTLPPALCRTLRFVTSWAIRPLAFRSKHLWDLSNFRTARKGPPVLFFTKIVSPCPPPLSEDSTTHFSAQGPFGVFICLKLNAGSYVNPSLLRSVFVHICYCRSLSDQFKTGLILYADEAQLPIYDSIKKLPRVYRNTRTDFSPK